MNQMPKVSESYMSFASNAGEPYQIWMDTVQKLSKASQLEHKTAALADIAVLAVMRLRERLAIPRQTCQNVGGIPRRNYFCDFSGTTGGGQYRNPINTRGGTSI